MFPQGRRATLAVAENTAPGTNIGVAFTATDPDAGDTLTYSLRRGDRDSFSIDPNTGQLQTKAALDYETKSSYDNLAVRVTDSEGLIDAIVVTINVTDVNENRAPTFNARSATRAVAENTASGTNIGAAIAATDADNDTLTYSISGADAPSFSIVSTSGQLQTVAALDYETKASYTVIVSVSDGNGGSDSITVTIDITDVNENRAPVFSDGDTTTRSVAENIDSGKIGSAIAATDADNDTLIYSISGADAAAFRIVRKSGQLRIRAALDYETKSSYTVIVSVSDGNGGSDSITVTINVTDVDENRAPVFTDGSTTTRSVAENTASGTNIGAAIAATDADTSDTLTYSLSGTDASSFSIVSDSGQLQTKAALDYETKTTYSVTVSVSDGNGGSASIAVTINVTDVNENRAPVFTDGTSATRAVAENTAAGTNIGTAIIATDVDNDTLTYRLSGADADAFSIVSTSGQLRTQATLDYETKSSYTVIVSVSDGNGGSDSITVTINITDVDEIPVNLPTSDRTQQVRGAIVAAVPGVSNAADVTEAHLATITSLVLMNKNITSLKVGDFDGLINLKDLRLNGNALTALPSDIFDELKNLEILSLQRNALTALPSGIFDELKNLKEIFLARNTFTTLPSGVFDELKKLELCYVGNNILTSLPSGIFDELKSLQVLGLSDNALTSLPSGVFDELKNLKKIALSRNVLTSLPSGVFDELKKLEEIFLSGNALTTLPSGVFDGLIKLDMLILNSNGLTTLPSGIFDDLSSLTKLHLHRNKISDVPVLEGLTSLKDLYLSRNPISDLPSGVFDGLTKLSTLGLDSNGLTTLPSGIFDDLSSLTKLYLDWNKIGDVSVLEGLTSLKDLYLKRNPISDYTPLRRLKAANPGVNIDIDMNNNPPQFSDGASTTRAIAENTASGTNIGDAVSATDADSHTLTYTLGGTDASSFSIVRPSGQLQTKAALDFETKTAYTVTVTVYDGNHGGDRITVTITVTDAAGAAPSVQTPPALPDTTALLSNFPNPFNPETWIPYQLAEPADVTLTIYDVQGRVVRTLRLGNQPAGLYRSRSKAAHWDGRNHFGEEVTTGVYFYTLEAGDYAATRKLLIRK